jgi:hypothetical protein
MRFLYVAFLVSSCTASCAHLPVACAEEPSVDELIGLARTVSSADRQYQRIYVAGEMKMGGFFDIDFYAQYRAPDQYSMCIKNKLNATPFLYYVNKQLFIYDIVGDSLLYISNACFACKLCVENDKLRLNLRAWKSDDACNIFIDVKSFYGSKAPKSEIATVTSGNVCFTQTYASGFSVVGLIDRSRRCSFKKLDLIEGGARQPSIRINELAVDEDVVATWPVFPSMDHFVEKVAIKDLSNDVLFGKPATTEALRNSYFGFAAVTNKDLRKEYESQFGVRVNWDKVETSYRRTSLAIKDVLSLPVNADNKRR